MPPPPNQTRPEEFLFKTMEETIKIADYLFERLRQLGVRSLFGVPGDYNLTLLDYVEPAGIRWVGNCNELNAAYAADGYARTNGLGALVTTFGVGELSAANGIAGAYAEKVPVVHIVGTPSRTLQESRALMHHTFADGEYRRFAAMHSHITIGQTNLTDPRTALQQIEWILQQALLHSRPVYLEIPEDMVGFSVLTSSLIPVPPSQFINSCPQALECILQRMYSAQRPLILVDGESRPCGILGHIEDLIQSTGWPTWTTTFGKGLTNEQMRNVHGVYVGVYGNKEYKAYFESADLVIHLGPHLSDTNSQGFTILPNEEITIAFSETFVRVGGRTFRDLSCRGLIKQLLQELDRGQLVKVDGLPNYIIAVGETSLRDSITQEQFYRFVNPLFCSGDIVLTETGTAAHGGRSFRFPPNVRMITATTWLSIGYMLPATLGAALAQREGREREVPLPQTVEHRARPCVILFVGDGSLQMSIQELSTIIRQKVSAIIFIINNNGYTIERAIHGRNQGYNDIASWCHLQALSFFGDDEDHAKKSTFTARTWEELGSVLRVVRRGDGVRLVEVFMGQDDCQGSLSDLLKKQIAAEKMTE
ncbi:Pyruvate decarboxylase [Lachnellula subtilissima]|uniref:Pyruvate decarboxylase n=1 Tax=Lachnellula subtilissima TaxID=602034 RepID=A0A8H8RCH9_9HELO|nr:Pyruvate decarboxylase [Lachnellula subtilissima]